MRRSRDWKRRTNACGMGGVRDLHPRTLWVLRDPPRIGVMATGGSFQPPWRVSWGRFQEIWAGGRMFVGWVLGLISFLQPPRSPPRSCRRQRRGGLEVRTPPMGTPQLLPRRYVGWGWV